MAEKAKEQEKWIVGEVPTQTQPVIVDTTDDNNETKVYTVERAVVKILNELEIVKRLLS